MVGMQRLIAVIDLGSNSFYLTLARLKFPYEIIEQWREPVRLGAGLDKDGYLTKSATERAYKVLTQFKHSLSKIALVGIKAVGTSAIRQAKNKEEFINKASLILGVPIEVLEGNKEAQLIYQGVISQETTLTTKDKTIVIDIGGGSSEIILGQGATIIDSLSIEVGCITLQNKYFAGKCITPALFRDAVQWLQNSYMHAFKNFVIQNNEICFLSAGIANNLKKVSEVFFNHTTDSLNYHAIIELEAYILGFNTATGLELIGLEPDRALMLPWAMAILKAFILSINIKNIFLSTASLRQGLLNSLSTELNNKE